MKRACVFVALLLSALPARAETKLGVSGERFTINGAPTFLLGISYYGGAGAPDETVRRDLDDMRRDGFNWLRVWATWGGPDPDASAVGPNGSPREAAMARLRKLVESCDARGMAVDVTLSRQAGTTRPGGIADAAGHRRAVETLLTALRPHRNWYLDLANERNIGDARFVSYDELKTLRDYAKDLDPQRLITASHSSGDDDFLAAIEKYVSVVRVDFVAQHRGRYRGSARETEEMTRRYVRRMKDLGTVLPVHFQEPFRRGYADWQPAAEDYEADLRGAVRGGAAGWCFHNGDDRRTPDKRPRRSFDLHEHRLYEQLDDVEATVVRRLKPVVDAAAAGQ